MRQPLRGNPVLYLGAAAVFLTEDLFVSVGAGKAPRKPGEMSFVLASVRRAAQAGGVTFPFITRDSTSVRIENPKQRGCIYEEI